MTPDSIENIPQELRDLPQWVCHRDGEKVPIDPKTGRSAKANDPATWGTFEEAVAWATGHGGGIGFEFAADDPFCGIDLDHVIGEGGTLTQEARAIVDSLDTYTEVSPSGTGLHLIARAAKPKGGSRRGGFEMYDRLRYFRMTGNVFEGHGSINDRQEAVEAVHTRHVAKPQEGPSRPASTVREELDWDSEVVAVDTLVPQPPAQNAPLDAEAVIERMRNSPSWPAISRLLDGDTSDKGGNHSDADMALCNHLAYYCDRNERLMDEMFRRSGLMRDKWDEVHHPGDPFPTYGAHTVHEATSSCRECYSERKTRKDAQVQEGTSDAFVSLYDITGENLPEQDPEIVEGIFRERQVLLLAAPSKAGKTWLAVALMWALATGSEWLGAHCEKSVVVYCNLEVSPASFATRCEAVRKEMGMPHDAAHMVDVLNGRGVAYTAASLVDAVLARLRGTSACVIVDCLYAIETGSENDAEAIRALFAELNRLTAAGCSVVGIHHFPKGSSGMKASIDRMAGSSVFARSPDALLSLDPLDVDEESDEGRDLVEAGCRAYRLSFDLRDFKPRRPVDLIFTGTRFLPDVSGRLGMSHIAGSPQANGSHARKANAERYADEWERKSALVSESVNAAAFDGAKATVDYVHAYYNSHKEDYGVRSVSRGTFDNWLKPGRGEVPFVVNDGIVVQEDVGEATQEADERTPTV